MAWREFEDRDWKSGPLSKAKRRTGRQEFAIAAVAQPVRLCEDPQGSAAQVVGLPGRTRRHAVGAEQPLGEYAMAGAGRAAVECAQTKDHASAAFARKDRRRVHRSALRMSPEQEHGRKPLRRPLIDRHEHGRDSCSLAPVRPPDLARRRRGQTVPAVTGEAN